MDITDVNGKRLASRIEKLSRVSEFKVLNFNRQSTSGIQLRPMVLSKTIQTDSILPTPCEKQIIDLLSIYYNTPETESCRNDILAIIDSYSENQSTSKHCSILNKINQLTCIEIDIATGWVIDPDTRYIINPNTGYPYDPDTKLPINWNEQDLDTDELLGELDCQSIFLEYLDYLEYINNMSREEFENLEPELIRIFYLIMSFYKDNLNRGLDVSYCEFIKDNDLLNVFILPESPENTTKDPANPEDDWETPDDIEYEWENIIPVVVNPELVFDENLRTTIW